MDTVLLHSMSATETIRTPAQQELARMHGEDAACCPSCSRTAEEAEEEWTGRPQAASGGMSGMRQCVDAQVH